MAGSAALQQAAMACAKARVVKGRCGSLRSGDHEAMTLSSRGAGTLRDERGARTGTTRRRAAPTGSEAGDGGNQGGRLPSWAREAVSRGGKDPDEVERTLARAKEESDAMSVGMGILMRDMRRGLPLVSSVSFRFVSFSLTPFSSLPGVEGRDGARGREDPLCGSPAS